ncbi:MAG: mercuric transport protein [Polyangiaceae bacterium]|nr:mercuric transport protein [Polyangiaceae bacterium]
MREDLTRQASLGGAVAAAFAASACCVGPLVFALLGLGGAGALVALEPYRPIFIGLTLALLGVGWVLALRAPAARQVAGADDCGCELPRTNRAGRGLLWFATATVAALLAFPYVTPFLF